MKQSDKVEKARQGLKELYTFKCSNRLVCEYCGDVRSELDHFPPLSYVAKWGVSALAKKGISLSSVPCCRSCNSILSNRPLLTYEERLIYIYNKLLDKADKAVLWSQDELEELSGNLKRMVKARQLEVRRNIITRIRVIERNICNIP